MILFIYLDKTAQNLNIGHLFVIGHNIIIDIQTHFNISANQVDKELNLSL